MIHEYALEPELVATWGNRHDFRYFIEKFGLGQPRIVSRYPKVWKRLVWKALQSDNDLEGKRMEELLARLSERMVHRSGSFWEPERTWIENAHKEHERVPFRAILSRKNPTGHPNTLTAEGLDDRTVLWAAPRGATIARSASEMATTVASMLRIAKVIIFVDPYFRSSALTKNAPLVLSKTGPPWKGQMCETGGPGVALSPQGVWRGCYRNGAPAAVGATRPPGLHCAVAVGARHGMPSCLVQVQATCQRCSCSSWGSISREQTRVIS